MFVSLCVGGNGLAGVPPGSTTESIEKLNPPAPPPPKIVQSRPVLVAPESEPASLRLRETSIVGEIEPAMGLKMTSVVKEANEFSKGAFDRRTASCGYKGPGVALAGFRGALVSLPGRATDAGLRDCDRAAIRRDSQAARTRCAEQSCRRF